MICVCVFTPPNIKLASESINVFVVAHLTTQESGVAPGNQWMESMDGLSISGHPSR